MQEFKKILIRQLLKSSFYEFVKYFWSDSDPAKFVDGKLVKFYCEIAQYFSRWWAPYVPIKIDNIPKQTDKLRVIDVREDKKRNININVPPRHSKSQIFNVMLPVWIWLSYPIKAASVSHTTSLAAEMNTKRYRILNSEHWKELYDGKIELVTNTKGRLVNNLGGELYSIARESFTGYGADMILNDDIVNAEQARRDMQEMLNAWSYYQNTMPSRINNPEKSAILNIQQRLAPQDITGHILDNPKLAEQYIFVTIPAIFDKDTVLVCPISGDLLFFKKGEGLWPERFGDYSGLRANVGETVFQTQYLQNPIASDDTVVKPSMIIEKDMDSVPPIEKADFIYASHDFPVKDKDTSDFLGSILAYQVGSTIYIVDCLEEHMAFVKSIEYCENLASMYNGIIQVIENKANGAPVIQQLKDKLTGIQPFEPGSRSKTQRLESATLYMNAGNVVFVKNKKSDVDGRWLLSDDLTNLKNRLLSFPMVKHDDVVDAFSMLVLFAFLDKRNCVYDRSFNDSNIITIDDSISSLYKTTFFNKEGDIWKVLVVAVKYSENTKLYATKEFSFRAGPEEGMKKLKELLPEDKVFIDCSYIDSMQGLFYDGVSVERYETYDFNKEVLDLSLAFSKKQVFISNECVLCKNDIEMFKYASSVGDEVKYRTTKDGFVACLRCAVKYYGGIV